MPVEFEKLEGRKVRLTQPLCVEIADKPGHLHSVRVPVGFESDGASIPACFWWVVGPPIAGDHFEPAVVHDFLSDAAADHSERLMADATFRLLLKRYKVPAWKRAVMFMGVMLQGRFLWVPKVAAALFAVGVLICLLGARKPLPEPRVVLGSCKFVRVKDADTYVISVTRLIDIRADKCWAPENHLTKHPSEKPLGLQAEAFLNGIVKPGAECRLEVLPDGDEHIGDQITFGRVVGAVYLESGDGRSLGEITNHAGITFETKEELEAYLDEQDKLERFAQ